MASANSVLQDGAIRHQIFMTRVQDGVARRMLKLLGASRERIKARIEALDPTDGTLSRRRKRLDRLLSDVQDIQRQLQVQLKDGLKGELGEIAEAELDFQRRAIEAAAGEILASRFDFVSPARVRAAAISRPFQSAHLRWANAGAQVDEMIRRQMADVRQEIRQGFVLGDSLQQLVRRIRGTRAQNFRDGILDISRRGAETMVRTAVNHTANASRQVLYEDNADVVKGVRWMAILDSRTSPICRGRDGQIFPVDKGPRPPAHPNCRSTTVAVLKSFRDIGIDADDAPGIAGVLDGKAAPYQTYNDWLRTQPKAFVEEVLGKARADLYLAGELSLDKFVNINTGRVLSLRDLAVKEADAFSRAGVAFDLRSRTQRERLEATFRADIGREKFNRFLEEAEATIKETSQTRRRLSKAELAAVYGYTIKEEGQPLNSRLWGGEKKIAFADVASAGLSKLPDHIGIVERRMKLTPPQLAAFQPGETVRLLGFTSTSVGPAAGSGPHRFVIDSRNGKRIEGFSADRPEREVLFAHGTRFFVFKRIEEGDEVTIYMRDAE